MARSSTGKHPATGDHSARPLRLAVGADTSAPTHIRRDWRPDPANINFTDAIGVEAQRQTLEAEREVWIIKGYDTERSKSRLLLVQKNNPDRDFHEELAVADQNLVTIAEIVSAIDEQLAGLNT